MLLFPKGYFDDDIREGFHVDADMKCAWASQLEVLKLVEGICDKYGLKYFAYYGTLLGAVRHNGFIPWDDDIDIAMLREDYDKLLEVASSELPPGYFVRNAHTTEEAKSYISRIVNSDCINANQGFLLKHYGCPYAAGVDIFPLDYVSSDEKTRQEKDDCIQLVYDISERTSENPLENKNNRLLQDGYDALEKQFDFKFDRSGDMVNQMLRLFDFVSVLYSDPQDYLVANYSNYVRYSKSFVFHKIWLSDMVDLGFEVDTIRAPIGLEAVLNICYGNNFMTPVSFSVHGSPFEQQKNQLIEGGLYDKVLDARKIVRDVMCLGGEKTEPDMTMEPVPDDIMEVLKRTGSSSQKNRKVILYVLNSASIVRYGESVIDKIESSINVFEENKNDVAVLLVEDVTFLATLNDMYPDAFDKYMTLRGYVCDNYIGAVSDNLYYDYVSVCDAYYGDGTSVIGGFQKAGKPVMLQNYAIL